MNKFIFTGLQIHVSSLRTIQQKDFMMRSEDFQIEQSDSFSQPLITAVLLCSWPEWRFVRRMMSFSQNDTRARSEEGQLFLQALL